MENGFAVWVSSKTRRMAGEVVAIDGKSLSGTRQAGQKSIVPMVSAWGSGNNLALGQRKVDDRSNEITAIPKLLVTLERSVAVGCQNAIAEKIVAKNANYVLALKENQGHMKGKRFKAGWDHSYLLN